MRANPLVSLGYFERASEIKAVIDRGPIAKFIVRRPILTIIVIGKIIQLTVLQVAVAVLEHTGLVFERVVAVGFD